MMYTNANVIGLGTYLPQKFYDSNFFIAHYDKMGMDIRGLLNKLGRDTLYKADNGNETSLTMAFEASKEAIKDAGITEDMIDMIVFVSSTPEYLAPTNAIKLSHMLDTKNAHILYDMNSCCTGVITAVDLVGRFMQSKKNIRCALIVGAIHISAHTSEKSPLYYASISDASGAMIIQNVEEPAKRGFIDSEHMSDTSYHWSVSTPNNGLSNIYRDDIPGEQKKGIINPFDFDACLQSWVSVIKKITANNNLRVDDIDHFIFSQFSITAIKETLEQLNVSRDKAAFIGDKVGYTGESSPIFALKEARAQGKIKEGSKVILISIGAGYSISSVLWYF